EPPGPLHGARQLRAAAGGGGRRPCRQPHQPRAQPGGGLSGVLRRGQGGGRRVAMLRYAFRLHRWGMLGYGLVLFVGMYTQRAAFVEVAGSTVASRAAFARSMAALAAQLSYIFPAPFRLDTLAGYVQWRSYGPFAPFLAIWAIAAAAGAVRGDEDRQLV